MFNVVLEYGFLTQNDFDKILFSESLKEIENVINSYTPPDFVSGVIIFYYAFWGQVQSLR